MKPYDPAYRNYVLDIEDRIQMTYQAAVQNEDLVTAAIISAVLTLWKTVIVAVRFSR